MNSREIAKADLLPDYFPPSFEHDGHRFEVRHDRIVRDGKEVAVLVSPGYGGGFTTWCDGVSPMEPRLVALVLAGKIGELSRADPDQVAAWLGLGEGDYLYLGGADNLVIQYVPLGTAFRIDEYDGSESLTMTDDRTWRA